MKDLTICIPTFQRDAFLQWTLAKTLADFPLAKVIVSDNAKSTLELPPSVRYIRQPQNIGAFPNMRAALLAASTKYCTFLGDDDYLLPEEVQKGIDFLETHPEVLVYYAPCQLYDEIEQKSNWDAFYVSEDRTFTRADELWNFIMYRHVWPEHAIYRRARLDEILQPRSAAYWCFVDLANAACRGPVHFAKTPFYRNLTGHPVGLRVKLGDQQCLTDFDAYRTGLEVLANDIFVQALMSKQEPSLLPMINTMIRQFMWSRYEVAVRILTSQNRLAEADVLKKRMAITGYQEIPNGNENSLDAQGGPRPREGQQPEGARLNGRDALPSADAVLGG
jgi:glycosyltransferase involved in cell wall biosynthesis